MQSPESARFAPWAAFRRPAHSGRARPDAGPGAGNRADAVALYKQIAAKDDSAIGSVARIRAGWAMVDFAPKSDVVAVLGPLTDPSNPWKQVAGEISEERDHASASMGLRTRLRAATVSRNAAAKLGSEAPPQGSACG